MSFLSRKANLEGNIIPKFMEDMPQFKRNLEVIAKCNFIDWVRGTWSNPCEACRPEPTYYNRDINCYLLYTLTNYLQLDHLEVRRLLQVDHGFRQESLDQLVGVVLRLRESVHRVYTSLIHFFLPIQSKTTSPVLWCLSSSLAVPWSLSDLVMRLNIKRVFLDFLR